MGQTTTMSLEDPDVLSTLSRTDLERAVRQSQAQVRALIDHAPEPIVLLNPATGTFIDANEAAASLFGLSRREVLTRGPIGMSPTHQPDGERSDIAAKRHIEAALAGPPQEFDWTHCDGAGANLPCRVQLLRLPADDTFVIRGSLTDLRNVHALKSALATERHINTRLLHTVSGTLHVHDLRYERVQMVPTGPDATPIDLEELRKLPRAPDAGVARIHPDDRAFVDEALFRQIQNLADGQEFTLRLRVRQDDGTYRWTRSTTTVFSRDAAGVPEFYLTQAQDDQQRADMESELEQQRRFNQRLLSTMPGAVHIFEFATESFSFETKNLRSLLGQSPPKTPAATGTVPSELLHPDEQQAFREHLERLAGLADGEVSVRRARFVRDDGSVGWLETWNTPFERNRAGEVTHLLGITQDITEHHIAEQDKQMRKLTDQLDVGVFEVQIGDGRYEVTRCNTAYLDIMGSGGAGQIDGGDYLDEYHPEDRSVVRAAFDGVMNARDGTYTSQPMRHRKTSDSPYRWLQWHQVVEHIGSTVVTRGYVADVTKRIEDEAALARLEAQFKTALDHLPIPVALIRDGSSLAYTNATFQTLFSLRDTPKHLADFANKTAPTDCHPSDILSNLQSLFSRSHGSKSSECVAGQKLQPQNGANPILVDAHYRLLDGKTCLGILAFVDVTQRELAADAQRRRVADVEKLNTELDASNRELEAFSYSVSHDLRAPLRHIDAFSAAITEDVEDLDPLAKNYLSRIRRSSQRMGRLIDDLLKLSRVGRADISVAPVDVSSMARSIAQRLSQRAPERDVEWNIAEHVKCHVDPALFRLALENVLENAFKYTAEEPVARIVLRSRHRDDGVELCVQDNGVGYDPTYADKLFQPFQRLHSDQSFSGTGIGLATVRRIVERHHGSVSAEATPGEGAMFTLFLPKPHLHE